MCNVMKIAFVTLPRTHGFALTEDCCWGLTRARYLPAALLASASQVESSFFFDLSIEPPENLELLKPDLIVYSLFPYLPTIAGLLHSIMSKVCEGVPKIVLAVPPGYMEDYARLEPNPFCVVYSEPEAVFSDFHVTSKEELVEWRSGSRGTAWVDEAGFHRTEPMRTCIHAIKGTDWDLVPPSYWFHYDRVIYQISRGCPWRCNFCVWGGSTVTDLTFRMRPAEQVASDLTKLRETASRYMYGVAAIPLQTLSAQLTTDSRWIQEYHALMEDRPYPFQGNINLREVTEEKLELLSQAGMNLFFAGLEGLTDPLLRRMNKPHSFEDVIESIRILNESGVNYSLKLISGGYGETQSEIRECLDNIEVMRRRGIGHSKIVMGGPIVYYKGTVIAENPPEELAYDMRHKGLRQRYIHADEWITVRRKLRDYNLLDRVNSDYPVRRLKRPI